LRAQSARQDDAHGSVERVYRRHRNWLVRFLRKRFGGQVAEELAQEAFARALSVQAEMRNPRAYLASIAVNAGLEQVRQERRHRETGQRPPSCTMTQPDQEAALLLEQIILQLPPDLREVLLLSRFGGLSNVEIAHRCNLSVKRIEARITRARAMCAALMRD
jgi:RNA polymerase sigma factor (sigma-70 family)